VAFHLHRLKLVGAALHRAGYHKTDAADLAAGRVPLGFPEITALAAALGIPLAEISRPLTSAEKREWAFYRAAASDPRHVWDAARAAWTDKGLTDKDAAAIMGFQKSTLADAKRNPFALTFTAALQLTTALQTPGGPEALLPLPSRDKAEQTR
jgi:hypothetical protein